MALDVALPPRRDQLNQQAKAFAARMVKDPRIAEKPYGPYTDRVEQAIHAGEPLIGTVLDDLDDAMTRMSDILRIEPRGTDKTEVHRRAAAIVVVAQIKSAKQALNLAAGLLR